MKEHYIVNKVQVLYDWDATTIERMKEEQKIARAVNKITNEIEKQTTELQHRLAGYVCHALERELKR